MAKESKEKPKEKTKEDHKAIIKLFSNNII